MDYSKKIFKDKSLSDLLGEIYDNSEKTRIDISTTMQELSPYLHESGSASRFAPIVKDFVEVSVKNDEQLLKIANVIQKVENMTSKQGGSEDDIFKSLGIESLLEEHDNLQKQLPPAKDEK